MEKQITFVGFASSQSIGFYIDKKLKSLEKLTQSLDPEGEGEAFFELSRTTRHHHKGDVYRVAVDFKIPGHIFRAESEGSNIPRAIDEVKDKLKILLEKHKERNAASRKK